MRIIGGKYKAKRFSIPNGLNLRPTTDIAKEGLFNYLENIFDFEKIKVLDLYSGTGSISFEFASRGCTGVTLVELERKHFREIIKNINILSFEGIIAKNADSKRFVNKAEEKFDIVFADPPYTGGNIEEIPHLVLNSDILKDKGIFILEHSSKMSFHDHKFYSETKRYGSVSFSVFK